MKSCSFLPAATIMIQDMELEEFLYGVTLECPSDKPKVVRSVLEGNQYTSREIDNIVSQAKAQGKGLYYIDEELLQSIAPDIIFTQDVCDVCQIDTGYVQRAVLKLEKQPELIPLVPRNLEDVYDNIITIARVLNREENADSLLAKIKNRTDKITDTLRVHKASVKRVMVMEWLDPVYNCGHWIPDMISIAGGTDMLGNPSGYSIVVPWEKVLLYNPEILVIAPCGFKPERIMQEMNTLTKQQGWKTLAAVRNDAVYIADSDLFTCPGSRLVEGIELLAALFHPDLFLSSYPVSGKVVHFTGSSEMK